jgi:uncharacterized protein
MPTEAFFLPVPSGQRFCLFHAPHIAQPRGAVIYVHPFAEEMNKSRRMAALQSRALAAAGYAVLQIDLLGCGDSSGDFGDASWQAWVDDLLLAAGWLQQRADAPLWFWGLRAGCLLATEAARQAAAPCRLLFWHPAATGSTVLQQLLRTKLAANLAGGNAKGAMQALRAQLTAGETLEVAGYALSPDLTRGLERATLQAPPHAERLEWLELSTQPEPTLSPAAETNRALWQQAGCAVRAEVVAGPAFWQTAEIEEVPALIDATLSSLQEAAA